VASAKKLKSAKVVKMVLTTQLKDVYLYQMNICTYRSGGYATMSEQERAKIDRFIAWLLEHPEKIPAAEQALDLE
jgi:hypothetical protein